MNDSVILNGDYAIYDVWNLYNSQKFHDRKRGKFTNRFLSEDDIKEMIYRKASTKLKYDFPENKRKHNASLTVFHETNTKNI